MSLRPASPFSLGLVACALMGAGDIKPVPIMPEADECAQCRMAVEDEHLAAELIAADGAVLKFDELGCMVAFVKARGPRLAPPRALFVKDFKTTAWLPLARATIVKSKFPTPMRYGLLAFGSPAEAKRLEARHAGPLTSWKALTGGK